MTVMTVPASWHRRGRPGPRGKRRMPELKISEDAIQIALMDHLELRAVAGVEYWHVPNGGARSKSEGARFKAMGVRAGMQDVHLLARGTLYVLELKTEKGRLSAAQEDMAARMTAAGAIWAVAYGLDEAIAQLEAWGLLRPVRSGAGSTR